MKKKDSEQKNTIQDETAFPIVGIGASAGGLSAFEAFFAGMPADTDPGMAFILVQHLAPDHKSILTDLIRRYTRMQVFEVEDGMTVQINCAYIIPPGYDMAFLNGSLQLLEPSAPRGQRLPIDFFFRSLAADQRERSIGIVLSGTGSDGSLGVRAIKGEAGMVIAQTPESSEYDGMPRSAIATGMVDFILPPAEMAASLIAYTFHAFGKTPLDITPTTTTANALKKIFILLRAQTGHDFSLYKQKTIMRRIERRMAVHQMDRLDEYVKYLKTTSVEVNALFQDLLIGVTNFFRDPEVFAAFEDTVIPKLFEGKSSGSIIRVWVPGCSTGEEAYSIAILLTEYMEKIKQKISLQVFATDIDPQAIATARMGVYLASINVDISRERLSRFFTVEPARDNGIPESYRINKKIRDILIFSEQNVIKDPPFSKLDLISCRNLMIYLGVDLQRRLIPLFHYALNPRGFLFLGTSETVGEYADLFTILNHKAKLYQSTGNLHRSTRLALGGFLPQMTLKEGALIQTQKNKEKNERVPLRQIAEQTLIKKLAPSSALVNKDGDIFYIHGKTGMYLEPAIGEVGNYNILKMAREGLRRELSTALHKAVHSNETVRCLGLPVKTEGNITAVNVTICKAETTSDDLFSSSLYLVILEEGQSSLNGKDTESSHLTESVQEGIVASLRQELKAKEEYLQSANEELETSNEELKSSNEEMQSVNEELQSTNEELETSKEELQSVNEELATVNAELQTKVTDLSLVNNDMNNLLAGTGIATVFVDYQLCIMRFTPMASAIINLVKNDIGRPINHFVNNLIGYENLIVDIQSVLDTLIPKEIDVQTAKGIWFTMRILPYRTIDNVIEGAVITFVDITESKKLSDALKRSEKNYRLLFQNIDSVNSLYEVIEDETGHPCDYRCLDVNPTFEKFVGRKASELTGRTLREIFPRTEQEWKDRFDKVATTGVQDHFEQYFIELNSYTDINIYSPQKGQVAMTSLDISERKRSEDKLKALLAEKELLLKEVNHRIKNNMNTMKSLLLLQAGMLDDKTAITALKTASNRMQSMALLYEKLYQSKNYSELSINDYLSPLIDEILVNLPKNKAITVKKHIGQFILDANRLQCLGIIINELLTNIIKYAFADRNDGTITVSATLCDGSISVKVADNGKGIPESVDFENSTGFGLMLVKALAAQLDGTIRLERNEGTTIVVEFKQ